MTRLFAALTVTTLFVAPASAQSYDCKTWQTLFDSIRYAEATTQRDAITDCHTQKTNWAKRDKYGFTALSAAVNEADLTMLQALLEVGVSPNLLDRTKETAAHSAAVPSIGRDVQQRLKALDLLAKHGADFEIVDRYGQTPLLVAASFNEVAIVKRLMKHGANEAVMTSSGRNALFFTVQGGCAVEVGNMLLDKGLRADQMGQNLQSMMKLGLSLQCNGTSAEKAYAKRLTATMN